MTKEYLQPLHDFVVIKQDEATTHVGTILLPDSAVQKPTEGTIIEVGSGKYVNGVLVPLDVHKGDRVFFRPYGPEVKLNRNVDVFRVIQESEVVAIIRTQELNENVVS